MSTVQRGRRDVVSRRTPRLYAANLLCSGSPAQRTRDGVGCRIKTRRGGGSRMKAEAGPKRPRGQSVYNNATHRPAAVGLEGLMDSRRQPQMA